MEAAVTKVTGQAIWADIRLLNEELLNCIVEVARKDVGHCSKLFDLPCSVVNCLLKIDAMSDPGLGIDSLLDFASTPAPLWKMSLTSFELQRMASQPLPMAEAELEQYRPVVCRLNRAVLGLLARYANDPVHAALVCDVSNPTVLRDLLSTPCLSLLVQAENSRRPLVEPLINSAMLDHFFSAGYTLPAPGLRRLVALSTMHQSSYLILRRELQEDMSVQQSDVPDTVARTGDILKPGDGQLALTMLNFGMKPTEVHRYLAGRGISRLHLERTKAQLGPAVEKDMEKVSFWDNAERRLMANAIFLKQRALIRLGLEPVHALVESFEFFRTTCDDDFESLTLSRVMKELHKRILAGRMEIHFCPKCEVGYVSPPEIVHPIDCAVCSLRFRGVLGTKRKWRSYCEQDTEVLEAA